jgi:Cytochrome c7 and related cytochrome c
MTISIIGVSTLLWAQDKPAPTTGDEPPCPVKKQGRAAFAVNRTKGDTSCSIDKNTFNHTLHTKPTEKNKAALTVKNAKGEVVPTTCSTCHSYVAADDPARGEMKGDIRRPGHKTCLACHGILPKDQLMSNGKPMASFYETKAEARTICANCHSDLLGPDQKPIVGSYNDMTKPLEVTDYGIASDKPPCGIEFGFDFSHKVHADQSCSECHAPVADCKSYAKEVKELNPKLAAMLGYDKPDAKIPKNEKGEIIDAYGNPAGCTDKASETLCDQQTLSSPSHAQCWTCHAEGSKKGTDDGKDPYSKAGADRCESCHAAKPPPEDGKKPEEYFTAPYSKNRDFWANSFTHKNHMASLDKNAPKVDAGAKCRVCHRSQVEAESLNDTNKSMSKDIYGKNMCFCCHDGSPAFPGEDMMMGTCKRCHPGEGFAAQPSGSHRCIDSKGFDEAVKTYLGVDKLKK